MLKIEMFMNEKGRVVAELNDEKWLLDLTLLCDQPPLKLLKYQTSKTTETHF
jgi:hypothetical protein